MDGQFTRSSFATEHEDADHVEVELSGAVFVRVRASSDADGGACSHCRREPSLVFMPFEWAEFVRGVKAGEFDLPDGHGWPSDAIALQRGGGV